MRIFKKKNRIIIILASMLLLCSAVLLFFNIDLNASKPAEANQTETNQKIANPEKPVNPTNSDQTKKSESKKVVYLTFDDGPSKLTENFLDLLKEHNIKATFFMIGKNIQNPDYQKNMKRAVDEGHYIGAHSMTHDNTKLYKKKQFLSEMDKTTSLIQDVIGQSPKLVRPPYGSAPGLNNKGIRDQIAKKGLKVWDWTIDSNDWKLKDNPKQIIENVKQHTSKDIEVVLMHETPQTLEALPEIIKFYKDEGYEFDVYSESAHFVCNFQKDERL
ncbi:peptidoglycan/xylan/chitin deacetylase (PgdA/CDA1 family) [Croceifilum oryzae]|uniref:Peptidoglycan/xylan/chitin deacetylase (PgdA/CDA1 family) n=1 Tax=Croceifilum oryzae TaxID=1553429 RepID=A0AAJ1THF1_9BACL|nr:polysaccharide deacetylase family protein [Croceifilum oryzae]MDQ0417037.1 peptidoglycan/xylan/chitin deacetylase (PgdA/CDA1 family) [Croceifilum oryzae]